MVTDKVRMLMKLVESRLGVFLVWPSCLDRGWFRLLHAGYPFFARELRTAGRFLCIFYLFSFELRAPPSSGTDEDRDAVIRVDRLLFYSYRTVVGSQIHLANTK